MSKPHELPKNFDPSAFEMKWYRLHEEAGLFRPEVAPPEAEPFVIVIPPPNVTGKLHLGHALGRTLEDILCRWRGMQGRAVLWFPGVDHADRDADGRGAGSDGADGSVAARRRARGVPRALPRMGGGPPRPHPEPDPPPRLLGRL